MKDESTLLPLQNNTSSGSLRRRSICNAQDEPLRANAVAESAGCHRAFSGNGPFGARRRETSTAFTVFMAMYSVGLYFFEWECGGWSPGRVLLAVSDLMFVSKFILNLVTARKEKENKNSCHCRTAFNVLRSNPQRMLYFIGFIPWGLIFWRFAVPSIQIILFLRISSVFTIEIVGEWIKCIYYGFREWMESSNVYFAAFFHYGLHVCIVEGGGGHCIGCCRSLDCSVYR